MRYMLAILSVLTALLGSFSALAEMRDLVAMPKVPAGSVSIGGEYWALIIGIDKYRSVDTLEMAVHDAEAVRDVLIGRYGFARERVTLLLNEQATRKGIEDALYRLRKKVGKEDSVLIYYAGHGQLDREDEIGYWVPVEGEAQSPGTFINNAVIRDEVAAMKAKHVYLVADSCFSGSLFAKSRTLPPLNDKFFATLYAKKSRWGLTSGQNEPVADRGKDGHSMFAYFFLKLLRDNEEPYLVPSHIFEQVARLVSNNSSQQPRSQPLQNAGDEGGQFVLRLAGAVTARAGASAVKPDPAPSVALTQAEQELKALEEQERQVEEQKKLATVQQQIEEKKQQVERKKQEVIQEARVRPPSAPGQTGRELTGKDGAPMLLVPAGEFMMGSNSGDADEKPAHRVSLGAFYMDKYELPTSRYAKFLQETEREKPGRWNEASLVSDGDRPVIGVTWHDAEAYCKWAGKRLPTEVEWEKAARGTDGRTYPWGNEEPSGRRANFGKSTWSYSILAAVGSYEDGASPYGVHDMAGNVWEWVADWYDEKYYADSPERNPKGPPSGEKKVLRGGSWYVKADYLRSSDRHGGYPSARHNGVGFRCAQDAK